MLHKASARLITPMYTRVCLLFHVMVKLDYNGILMFNQGDQIEC